MHAATIEPDGQTVQIDDQQIERADILTAPNGNTYRVHRCYTDAEGAVRLKLRGLEHPFTMYAKARHVATSLTTGDWRRDDNSQSATQQMVSSND